MINKDFKSILELVITFKDEQTCIEHLEDLRWNGNVVSPFDPESKVYKCKGNRYKCKNTGKYFNVKTATLFDNTKIELQKWFIAIWLITSHKKGISSLQLSRDLDITQKSAWYMLHRIRKCFGINDEPLDGDVEVDEAFLGGKAKNKHLSKRIADKDKPHKAMQPVIGMVERGGRVKANTVSGISHFDLMPEMIQNIKESARIFTDENKSYNGVKHIFSSHGKVRHGRSQYVDGVAHTNTIEGFWSLLKRMHYGIYHFISVKHLQAYIDEMAFRYNTRDMNESGRFNVLLGNTTHTLTYKELIA